MTPDPRLPTFSRQRQTRAGSLRELAKGVARRNPKGGACLRDQKLLSPWFGSEAVYTCEYTLSASILGLSRELHLENHTACLENQQHAHLCGRGTWQGRRGRRSTGRWRFQIPLVRARCRVFYHPAMSRTDLKSTAWSYCGSRLLLMSDSKHSTRRGCAAHVAGRSISSSSSVGMCQDLLFSSFRKVMLLSASMIHCIQSTSTTVSSMDTKYLNSTSLLIVVGGIPSSPAPAWEGNCAGISGFLGRVVPLPARQQVGLEEQQRLGSCQSTGIFHQTY